MTEENLTKGNNELDKDSEVNKTESRIDNNPDKKLDFKKIRENPWIISTIILGIAIIILLVFVINGKITGKVISEDEAGQRVVNFVKSQGGNIDLVDVNEKNDFYEVRVLFQGQKIPVYVTKDGENLITNLIPLTGNVVNNEVSQNKNQQNQASENQNPRQNLQQDISKSDKPKVELFVMSYCPYGTQAEKGIIPVFELLKDKIDAKIRFIHYTMHGEKEDNENYRQICIREEQSSKYLNYLKCFLEDGNSPRCLDKIKIDKVQLNTCINKNAENYYKEDSKLSENYEVRGSPTLIINGQQINSARDSASFLATICSSFNNAPDECQNQLNSVSFGPGFGYSTNEETANGESNSEAQCN